MHEEKTGYFRYTKLVRRQDSDWGRGGLPHACMHIFTAEFKGSHALLTRNPWWEEESRAGTHKLVVLLAASLSCPFTSKLAN